MNPGDENIRTITMPDLNIKLVAENKPGFDSMRFDLELDEMPAHLKVSQEMSMLTIKEFIVSKVPQFKGKVENVCLFFNDAQMNDGDTLKYCVALLGGSDVTIKYKFSDAN